MADDPAKDAIEARKHAYQQALGGIPGETVMADLARFCRAEESTYHADARAHALLEGRREVYLRIWHHMNRSVDELCATYGAVKQQEKT